MQLSIDSLKEMGAFTGAPVQKEISWKQGEQEFTATVFVRPLSYLSTVGDLTSAHYRHDPVAARIAACICDEKGAAVFHPLDITNGPIIRGEDGKPLLDDEGNVRRTGGALDGGLTMALLTAMGEVNGTSGKTKS